MKLTGILRIEDVTDSLRDDIPKPWEIENIQDLERKKETRLPLRIYAPLPQEPYGQPEIGSGYVVDNLIKPNYI
jgi:hypothetical protein